MAIPDAVVDLALGADLAADPVDWTWTDITSRVRYDPGIQITQGRRDETGSSQPAQCRLTLDNTDALFSPRNPNGAHYPYIRLNTPLRVRVKVVKDTFTRSASSSFGTADSGQTPDTGGGTGTDFSVTGTVGQILLGSVNVSRRVVYVDTLKDSEQVVTVAASAVATGAALCAEVMFRCDDADDGLQHYRARVEFGLAGALSVKLLKRVGGGDTTLDTGALVDTYSGGTLVRLRARIDGSTLRARAWLAANTEPTTWDVEATDTDITAAAGVGLRAVALTGNTNVSPNIQFDNYDTLVERFVGHVDEWPLRWHESGNERHVDVTASGVMRRLGQGGDLRSALYREIIASSPVEYWPCENVAPGANQAANAIVGGNAIVGSIDLEGTDGPPGSGEVVDLSNRGWSYGHTRYRSTTSWRIELVAKVPAAEITADGPVVIEWFTEGANSYWRLTVQADGFYYIERYSGGAFSNYVSTTSTAIDGAWHHLRIDFSQSGGNIACTLYRDGTSIGTGSVAGTLQWPEYLAMITFDTIDDGNLPAVGHFALWSSQPAADTADAAFGFTGERAGDRIARICTEEGLSYTATASTGEELGPQPGGSVLEVLRDVDEADHGLLYEAGGRIAYLCRSERYNLDVAMALDFDSKHIQPGWEANDDDQQIRNSVTASRPGGSTGATYTIADGPQGTDTVGVYSETLNVNVAYDDQLYAHAGWRVGIGTVDDYRFPVIGLNFARTASLIPTWLSAGIGSRVTVANPPSELPPGSLDLHCVGYEEFISPKLWSAVLNTAPARPYDVIVLDGTDNTSRLDTGGTVLNGAIDDNDTTVAITVTGTAGWDTADEPWDIEIGGEQMTVTANAASGGPFTVTRSVNGVVKSHSSGAEVKLWRPNVIAL